MFLDEGKSKGTATHFVNDTRHFFHDDETTLWSTLSGQRLWWAFFDPALPELHPDAQGTVRRSSAAGAPPISGAVLTVDRLAGSLTKVAAYRWPA